MNRTTGLAAGALVAIAIVAAVALSRAQSSSPVVEVFKTPTCGCCAQWVEHLRSNGFTVKTTDLPNLSEIKHTRGVPPALQSCHTAVVGGYVVEGHVPAADVHRLLKEKPAVTGIAVGGMPIGSPGMETPYMKAEPYEVIAFDKTSGATRVYAKH